MSQPAHSDATVTHSTDANGPKGRGAQPDQPDHQKTLLLSDVPEASALMPEADATAAMPPSGTATGSTAQPPKPHFPTLDLSPLSQRYELLAEAGHGSMGNVYKARDRETGETVALKLLKPEIASDQTMMERFKKELLFARKITHKNVCRVHEFNRIGGIAYTSMEFVEGDSLRSVLNRFGGLPLRKGLDLSLQMCSALQEAHAQGIVHRDLKPENVMIDTQGNVKIMDFGIARSMDAMTRLTGSMVGTPAYMAPEQVAGKQVDFRTDIYALGLILYEIFTGQPTFQAENAVAVALKQMREAPKAPHEIDASIPFGIERAIMKCLQKDPENRFQSIAQLADALRAPAAAASANAPAVAASAPSPVAASLASSERSTNATSFTPHPLYGASALRVAEPKRRSKSGWVLVLLLLGGGAFAAMRWNQVVQAEREYEPLTVSAAKYYYAQAESFIKGVLAKENLQPTAQAPIKASDQSNAQQQVTPTAPSSAAEAPTSAPAPSSVDTEDPGAAPAPNVDAALPLTVTHQSQLETAAAPSFSSSAASHPHKAASQSRAKAPAAFVHETSTASRALSAASKKASPNPANRAPAAVQQRANAAFGESTLSVPPVNNKSPRFLLIGRFNTEDRAQERARKVEGLGLPVIVIPRRMAGREFFIVLSGPFGPERVESVMEWLKEQGFAGIRVLKDPMRNGRLVPGVEQDPEN
jgi:serine/threonine protein kinase